MAEDSIDLVVGGLIAARRKCAAAAVFGPNSLQAARVWIKVAHLKSHEAHETAPPWSSQQ